MARHRSNLSERTLLILLSAVVVLVAAKPFMQRTQRILLRLEVHALDRERMELSKRLYSDTRPGSATHVRIPPADCEYVFPAVKGR